MAASKKPGYSVRVWISSEDIERFKTLSEVTQLSQSELMTKILHSGIEAVAECSATSLTLPVKFKLDKGLYPEPRSQSLALNERSTKKG